MLFLPKTKLQISRKLPYFGHYNSTRNEIVCYEERHPLLLKYLITFIRCIRMIGGAFESMYHLPHYCHHVISAKLYTQKHQANSLILVTPTTNGNGMMCLKQRHPLLLKYLRTFIRCMRMIGGSFESMYHLPHHCHHAISAKLYTQKYQANSLILVTEPTMEMR